MARPLFLLLAAALLLGGCGRTQPGQAAAPARSGVLGAKFTTDETDRYRNKIEKLVRYYDKDRDGAIAAAESPVKYGHDRTHVDERFNAKWVLRTEIDFDLHRRVKTFSGLDGNLDGRATTAEIVGAYLRDRDTNGDDGIGIWERVKAVMLTPSGRFETKWYQETGRRQYFVYSPEADPDRPTPPTIRPEPPPIPRDRAQPPLRVELPIE